MKITKLHFVYFSPTGTTQAVFRTIAKSFNMEPMEHDMTDYAAEKTQLEFEADDFFLESFCSELKKKIEAAPTKECFAKLTVPGKRPYRRYMKLPMAPAVNAFCTACGLCAKECPVGAISKQIPRKTDKKICIGCMRCVKVCPQKARHLPKLKMAAGKFYLSSAARIRKEPEMFLQNQIGNRLLAARIGQACLNA